MNIDSNENHLLAKIAQYVVVMNKDGQVLVLERSRSKTWTLPGGRLNKGEDIHESLLREVFEETQLPIQSPKPIYTALITDPFQTKYCVFFSTNRMEGVINISAEHSAYRWVDADGVQYLNWEDIHFRDAVLVALGHN